MKVTLITTCFNRAATIGRTIESVLGQDYPDIEYIVVDGASSDGSLEVIRRYQGIAQIVSEPDNGMYEAINKGLRMATGDIVGLVHSDDVLYDSHTVTAVVEAIMRSGADLLYGDGLYMRGDRVVRNWQGGPFRQWKVRMGWLPLHTTCYMRREALQRVGMYDQRYRIAADTDMLLRFLMVHRLSVTYLHRYLVRMEMGGLSTDSKRRVEMWHEDLAIFRTYGLPAVPMKLMKMAWKIPQFIRALWKKA